MQRALMHLPQPQREALILVGAGGFAYEEAAEICGCAVGTIKSRVARGRVALEQLLSSGKLPSRRQHKTDPDKSALQTIMGEVDELSRDHERVAGLGSRAERDTGLRWILDGSVQLAKQFGKVAVARLRRRSLEGAAESGRDSRVAGRHIDPDDPAVHRLRSGTETLSRSSFIADCKRPKARGSFVRCRQFM